MNNVDNLFINNMNKINNLNENLNSKEFEIKDINMNNVSIEMNFNDKMQFNNNEKKNNNIETDKELINNYYYSKLYQFDFELIEEQNKIYDEIKKKLSKKIKLIDENIKYNENIMNIYLNEPCKKENLSMLNDLICSLDEKFNNELKEIEFLKNEIVHLLNTSIDNLKKHYLDAYNKKYNGNLKEDNDLLVYTERKELTEMNETKFKQFCKINFNNLKTLEFFVNNISFKSFEKSSFNKLSTLIVYGKTTDIKLSNAPFKDLEILTLCGLDIHEIDNFFEEVPFHKLITLNLNKNKIEIIDGLSKASFHDLKTLTLSYNNIKNIDSLSKFPFTKLSCLDLSGNNIIDIEILSKANFSELKALILSDNNIKKINVFSSVNFKNLTSLYLDHNQIVNISALETAPFINL